MAHPRFEMLRQVRHIKRLSDFAFRLYSELLDCANEDGETWLSQKTLAERLDKSLSQTAAGMAELRQLGLLETKRRQRTSAISVLVGLDVRKTGNQNGLDVRKTGCLTSGKPEIKTAAPLYEPLTDCQSVPSPESDRLADFAQQLVQLPQVRRLMTHLGETLTAKVAADVQTQLRGAPLADLDRRIRHRFKAVNSMGLLPLLAADVGIVFHRVDKSRRQNDAITSQQEQKRYIEMLTEVRSRWGSYSEADQRWYSQNFPELRESA